ncbi:MAG TPA: RHS repeat domain-containing protein [Puia sp.]|nr:RHS repeat domain-containing protein [Puia sp.]
MKYLFVLLLPGLSVISACKKSALPAAGGNMLNKTELTVPGYAQLVDSFVYDGQQRLVEIISASSDFVAYTLVIDTITFEYDASGRVASWTQIIGTQGKVITYELSYDGSGRLVKALAVPVMNNIEFSDFSFAYDAEGRLVSDSVFAQHLAGIPSVGIMSYDNYTYDGNGNVASMQTFGSTSFVGAPFTAGVRNTLSYDNRVNPFYHSGIPPYCGNVTVTGLLSPNNQTGGTTTSVAALSPYTFSYAYFSNGRPRMQTTPVYGVRGTVTQTTEYFYQ